jgi:hypothetical protein
MTPMISAYGNGAATSTVISDIAIMVVVNKQLKERSATDLIQQGEPVGPEEIMQCKHCRKRP